jgi:hypothetical protein
MRIAFQTSIMVAMALNAFATSQATAQDNAVVVPENPPIKQKIEGRYLGPWLTTSTKKLNGTTNCEIKQLTNDHWQGRFWGEWQKVPFDYTVEFDRVRNPPEGLETAQTKVTKNVDLKNEPFGIPVAGKAMIDGASYDWIGRLTRDQFNIEFTGSRMRATWSLPASPKRRPGRKVSLARLSITQNYLSS